MSSIFEIKLSDRPARSQRNVNLKVVRVNQVIFGGKILRILGSTIWNRLLPYIKNAENFSTFKTLIKTLDGDSCKYNLCRKI